MDTYDLIFAGGGSTACVTAGRLAAADPTLRILLLEAGLHTHNVPQHIQPGYFLSHMVPNSKTLACHVAKPSELLFERAPIVLTACAVGGASSVNFMMYNRPAASDYDDWETKYRNSGWGSKEMISLSKKAETYQAEIANDTHGTSGPIRVSFCREQTPLGDNFLEVATEYNKERGLGEDLNDFTTVDKYGKWARYIDAQTGRRSDAAHHYIYNQIDDNPNLKVFDKCRVMRVLFENDRAVGVEYIKEDGNGQPDIVKASRLVVVSAGALGSPAILERSGIGAKEVLEKNGIAPVMNLPGVGENYMDHLLILTPYQASENFESMDSFFRGMENLEAHEKQWLKDGTGWLAQTGFEALGKIRPTAEDLESMSPEFDHRWETHYANAPDKHVFSIGSFTGYAGSTMIPIGRYFGLVYFMSYPLATGRVHVTSGLDPSAPLDLHPGLFDEPADVVLMRWGYKKFRELARRMKYYRGEVPAGHPAFPEDSVAAVKVDTLPVDIGAPDIVYTKEDDEAIDKYHREKVASSAHSCGTCAMKPRPEGGVVDHRLNVYGVQNLKVADLSITPGNVGTNTYNTAITIGEKAAVIIAEDLGIPGVA